MRGKILESDDMFLFSFDFLIIELINLAHD
jgi:hypothetical protein